MIHQLFLVISGNLADAGQNPYWSLTEVVALQGKKMVLQFCQKFSETYKSTRMSFVE